MQNGGPGGQNPFDMLRNLGDLKDIRKLLGPDFFKNLPMYGGEGGSEAFRETDTNSFPAADLYDAGSEFVLWLNLPGLGRTDISLQATPFHVVIRGQVPSLVPQRDDRLLVDERFYGPFERDVELPSRIQPDAVRASFTNGVLRVSLPKYSPNETEFNPSVPIDLE